MQINYLQDVKVKNYALIGKLWDGKGMWFAFTGVIGNQRDRKEVFEKIELVPGDRIYIAENRKMNTEKSPKYLMFVRKTTKEGELK